jgi:hypothetical protein
MAAKKWDDFASLRTWLTGMASGMSDVIGQQVSDLFAYAGQDGIKSLCYALDGEVLYLPMLITPELAALFESLETDHQRHANELTVDGYRRDMENSRWLETGDAFRFDTQGRLVDGGHRADAIKASGKVVRSLVVFGVQPEVALVIDSGRVRSTGNTLGFYGIPNYSEAAGAIPRLIAAEKGKWVKPSRYIKPTREEILVYYTSHPELADLITDAARRTSGTRRIPRATTTAVAIALAVMYRTPPHLHAEVRDFFDGLTTGSGLVDGSAVLVLRDTMSAGAPPQWRRASRSQDRGGFTIDETLALFFIAWNRRHETRVRSVKNSITFPLSDENFPQPKHVKMTSVKEAQKR